VIGIHYKKADWDNRAFQLWQIAKQFHNVASDIAADLTKFKEAAAIKSAVPEFSDDDIADLIAGVQAADALRAVAEGDSSPETVAKANTFAALVGKFGGA
jgi:hypothetical protein